MPKHRGSETGVACPHCDGRLSGVTDSRPEGKAIKRRRKCFVCEGRFTTFEVSLEQYNVLKSIDLDQMRTSALIVIEALDNLKRLRDNE